MTDERFQELVDGPLAHPLIPFRISRLMLALRDVVDRCGAAGDQALEAHCQAREASDRLKSGE